MIYGQVKKFGIMAWWGEKEDWRFGLAIYVGQALLAYTKLHNLSINKKILPPILKQLSMLKMVENWGFKQPQDEPVAIEPKGHDVRFAKVQPHKLHTN